MRRGDGVQCAALIGIVGVRVRVLGDGGLKVESDVSHVDNCETAGLTPGGNRTSGGGKRRSAGLRPPPTRLTVCRAYCRKSSGLRLQIQPF